MTDRAMALRAEGRDIISLSVGEPDFATPAHVVQAAKDALDAGDTKYTAVAGSARLRAAAAPFRARSRHRRSAGAGDRQRRGQAGDLPRAARHARSGRRGADPQPVVGQLSGNRALRRRRGGGPADAGGRGFRISAAQLEAAITPATRWLLLNSPGNPTGATYPAEELRALGEVLRRHPRVLVMSDDIYAPLRYGAGAHATLAVECPDLADRVLTVSGVSKSHAMTGFRIGVAAGPLWLINAMARLQSHSSGNPASISQAAAVAAFEGPQDFLLDWRERFRARRDLCVAAINAIPGLSTPVPDGAFYCMVDAAPLMARFGGESPNADEALCLHLLEHGVAVVAASALAAGTASASASRPTRRRWKKPCGALPAPWYDPAARCGSPRAGRRRHAGARFAKPSMNGFLRDDRFLHPVRRRRSAGHRQARRPAARPAARGRSVPGGSSRRSALRLPARAFPVHRLDRDTSGCLLLARNPKALKRFSAAFEARQVGKVYLGVVAGPVEGESGTVSLSLSKVSTEKDGWRMIPAKKGKPAVTHWRVVERRDGLTLVEFRPETGRTHQIRVHALAGLGHALLGDPVYGNGKGAKRTMLHAAALTVPREGKPPIEAQSPLPPDFHALGSIWLTMPTRSSPGRCR
jgi:aspartate aminotransferase